MLTVPYHSELLGAATKGNGEPASQPIATPLPMDLDKVQFPVSLTMLSSKARVIVRQLSVNQLSRRLFLLL